MNLRTDPIADLARRLMWIRKVIRKLSQEELATRAHTSQAQISNVESGVRPDPRMSTILGLAAGLGLRTTMIFTDPVTGRHWEVRLTDPPASEDAA